MHHYTSKTLTLFWSKVNMASPDECWEWQAGKDKDGYGRVTINYITLRAHRVSWIIANGDDIPDGLFVCHKCDNPPCVNPNHLFLGTVLDNARDKESKGRHKPFHGENHPNHKLTQAIVDYIRERHAKGDISQSAIARELNISFQRVSKIILRQSWK